MSTPVDSKALTDSIVCYCFNRSSSQLTEAYGRLGSLSEVQRETKVGSNCGGCRMVLESMFGENPDEILNLKRNASDRNICVKQGDRLMKGLVIANHRLDTVVYSSNGVPPQFAEQEISMPVEYMLLDMAGNPLFHRSTTLKSNETFCFDTRRENLPRPLYGMFLYRIGRSNYGGARFNSVWTNGISACSTHEINDSGRPSVVLPIPVDSAFLNGPNILYLALQNPKSWPIRLLMQVFDEPGNELGQYYRDLPPNTTQWLNVSKEIFKPLISRNPNVKLVVRINSDPMRSEFSPTMYFFMRNLNTDIWTANHL
jgi:bacterioferritin-associated ferredoxin